jgi:aspartate ammonia-lyase
MTLNTSRIEHDSLGDVPVPANAYWGAQTQRAVHNFCISGLRLHDFPQLIKAMVLVKLAAARANRKLGLLEPRLADAIEQACIEIAAGALNDQFIVDMVQGGAGTSTHMNANEVIANRAIERLGHARGAYEVVHPNNHVNLSQSTNDVYPTALRLSILLSLPALTEAMRLQ